MRKKGKGERVGFLSRKQGGPEDPPHIHVLIPKREKEDKGEKN